MGIFPSGAVAWRVSEEPFMKEFESISNMKCVLAMERQAQQLLIPT